MITWFLKTKYFVPDLYKSDIYSLDYKQLYESGIRILLVDLDNTLIPYDIAVPDTKLITLFESIQALGFEVVIISNNQRSRIKPFSLLIDLPFISSAKKPLKSGFKKALKKVNESPNPSEVLVIGDQLMTDVFGAKRMGYSVCLVEPIKKRSEKWYTKFNRAIEKKMLNKIERKYPQKYQELKLGKR